jgi:G6PDH family F420-dependent oxidoreductase
MPKIGYFLSTEEQTPQELVEQARLAEEAGFEALWISDHFHPVERRAGPGAAGVVHHRRDLAGLPAAGDDGGHLPDRCASTPRSSRRLPATSSVLLDGRFVLGVGSGEALNEHIFGDAWPSAAVRLEMLEEAVAVMRELWKGEYTYHRGAHYTVENARLYTLPPEPPKVYVSAFGDKALDLAIRIGDGFVTTKPDADSVKRFKAEAGADKVTQAGYKVAWAPTEDEGVKHAHRLWANAGLPGELAQVLPSPKHFEQASTLVTEDSTRESTVCGRDLGRHVEQFEEYRDAGFDEIFVSNIGPYYKEFFAFYRDEVLPRVRT